MKGAGGFVGTALIAAAMITGIAVDGYQLVKKWGAKPPVSVQELRLLELLAFEERNLDLPIVILTSVFQPHSIEYSFSPSPTDLLFFFPPELDETELSEIAVPEKKIARYRRWRKLAEEAGFTYSGDPTDLLDGTPKYIILHELDPEAVAGVEACSELELVHSSSGGINRWYKAN